MKTLLTGFLPAARVFNPSAKPEESETMSLIVKHHREGNQDRPLQAIPGALGSG
jgi:hypothetical protein